MTSTSQLVARRCRSSTTTSPPRAALGEPVVDGVLQQLGEHDRQRRGDACAGIRPPSPGHREPHRPVRRLQTLLGEAQQRPHDLDERDVVAGLARQRLVHERDRADAPHRLAAPRPSPRGWSAGGPAGAAATRSSAGCSSPGGGSRGSSRPCYSSNRSRLRRSVTSRTSSTPPSIARLVAVGT